MTTSITAPVARRTVMATYVGSKIAILQSAALADDQSRRGPAAGTLADLRRSNPADPGADPSLFTLFFDAMPQPLAGRGDQPSPGEWATAAALHLYAIHQQGHPTPMHIPGADKDFGSATRRLAQARGHAAELDDSIVRRFSMITRTNTRDMLITHLRAQIRLMRGEGIALDYGRLAGDLLELNDPRTASRVRLRWARSFHYRSTTTAAQPATEQE